MLCKGSLLERGAVPAPARVEAGVGQAASGRESSSPLSVVPGRLLSTDESVGGGKNVACGSDCDSMGR